MICSKHILKSRVLYKNVVGASVIDMGCLCFVDRKVMFLESFFFVISFGYNRVCYFYLFTHFF